MFGFLFVVLWGILGRLVFVLVLRKKGLGKKDKKKMNLFSY